VFFFFFLTPNGISIGRKEENRSPLLC